jgi:F0F1-type ATP synthase assembly protein I
MKNEWMKYSSLAFQILAIMLFGIAAGYYLDKYFNTTAPLVLLGSLILSVVAVLVIIIKTSGKP